MNLTIYNFNGTDIAQRPEDGYMDATSMCQANGKLFADYNRLDTTKDFLSALSENMGIPIFKLIETKAGRSGGTWVHPLVAGNLGQWCSAPFAVFVAVLIDEWRKAGQPDFRQTQQQPQSFNPAAEFMEAAQKAGFDPRLILEVSAAQFYAASSQPQTAAPETAQQPQRSKQVSVQKRKSYGPKLGSEMPSGFQRVLAVLSTDKAMSAAEVAKLAGMSESNARKMLVYLCRQRLAHRTGMHNPETRGWRYVYHKVETTRCAIAHKNTPDVAIEGL